MAGPTATLRSWADCTSPMADGTLSRGAETLASAITIGVKPAKSPMSARARKSAQPDVPSPIRATITTKPISDRISIILRPKRSARRPQDDADPVADRLRRDRGPDGARHIGLAALSR